MEVKTNLKIYADVFLVEFHSKLRHVNGKLSFRQQSLKTNGIYRHVFQRKFLLLDLLSSKCIEHAYARAFSMILSCNISCLNADRHL